LSNELTLATDMVVPDLLNSSYEELAQAAGRLIFKSEYDTPRLIPNLAFEDESGNRLDPGVFRLERDGTHLFAKKNKPVTFRPIVEAYRYQRYDGEFLNPDGTKGKMLNTSTVEWKLTGTFHDELGTVKCGKVKGEKSALSGTQVAVNKQTSVYRLIFGYVSGTFVTPSGEEVVLDEQECYLQRRGSDFLTFEEEFVKKAHKAKRPLHSCVLKITTQKHVNGQTVYYTVHYDWDQSKVVQVTQKDQDYITRIYSVMSKVNQRVMKKRADHLAGNAEGEGLDEVADVIDAEYTTTRDDDFSDENPF
jgi:hypothetical protein